MLSLLNLSTKHPKNDISEVLQGFVSSKENERGILLYKAKATDYLGLLKTFDIAAKESRERHIPIIIHVKDCTQPFGHSTSGSHEKYKSKERLQWEKENDCNKRFLEWIKEKNVLPLDEVESLKPEVKELVKNARDASYDEYQAQFSSARKQLLFILNEHEHESAKTISKKIEERETTPFSFLLSHARSFNILTKRTSESLSTWISQYSKSFRRALQLKTIQ